MRARWLIALAACAQASLAGTTVCLKSDSVGQIRMTGTSTARAMDRDRHTFHLTFMGPCGARHQNVFFVMKPDFMPACIKPGTALPTDSEGVCVVTEIEQK